MMKRLLTLAVTIAAFSASGVAANAGVPQPGLNPGVDHASDTGSCHGVFSDWQGYTISSHQYGNGYSADAPLGNVNGVWNSTGCPSGR